jgi:hypothetical protein
MATTSTIADLLSQVNARLQNDSYGPFWSPQNELTPAIAEAIGEMMLLIGRPTVQYNTLVTLTPNTVWQPMPTNLLAITNIQSAGTTLRKTTLHALDYTQASNTSSWESDRADVPAKWCPLGLRSFVVWPAPTQPIQVTMAGIAFPITSAWPFDPATLSPFHVEVNDALECYAAAYARLKDLGDDWAEGQQNYRQFLSVAARLSTISDREDDLIYSQGFGVETAPSQVSKR